MQHRWIAASAFTLYVALRVVSLTRGWHLDEFATLEIVRAQSLSTAMQLLRADTHFPGFFVPLYFWHQAGQHVVWLRVFPLLFDVTTLVLLAHHFQGQVQHFWQNAPLRDLHPARSCIAWAVALGLWGTNPLALRFATELRPYSALVCTCVLTYLVALKRVMAPQQGAANTHGAGRGLRDQAALGASALATVSLHPMDIFAVVAVFVAAAAAALSKARRAVCWRLAPALLAALAGFALLHWGFTLDPSAARISWMPAMSAPLFGRIVSVCFGLEDSSQYGPWSASLYGGGATGCLLFAWLVGLGCVADRRSRPAAWAAVTLLAMVVVYSVVAQPIFWYRSIAPAIALAMLAAGATVAARIRGGALVALAALVAWHASIFVPMATRAVDPAQEATQLALQLRQPNEPLYLYPDWMATCVGPLAGASSPNTVPLAAGLGAAPAKGTALVRCNLALYQAPDGLQAILAALGPGAAPFRELVLVHDDNDDLSQASQASRNTLLAALQRFQPGCQIVSQDGDRVARLSCK